MLKNIFRRNNDRSILDDLKKNHPHYQQLSDIESAQYSIPLMKKVLGSDGKIWEKYIKDHGEYLDLRPCSLKMRNGSFHENVYVSSKRSYKKLFGGMLPDSFLNFDEVAEISSSPNRVNNNIAHQIMKERKKYKDVVYFGVEFIDRRKLSILIGGDFTDFVRLPDGYSADEIKRVFSVNRDKVEVIGGNCDLEWCLL